MFTEITFGKHAGKTLPQILLNDPDWFFWALEQGTVFKGSLLDEAKDLYRKSRTIKIPRPNPNDFHIEYVFQADGTFAHFDIVDANRPSHVGSSITHRSTHLDFSVVRSSRIYDKTGNKLFLSCFRYHFFGSGSAYLTKDRAESFFSDPNNFH